MPVDYELKDEDGDTAPQLLPISVDAPPSCLTSVETSTQ